MIERRVALLGLLVDQHRMALRERAALAILAGQPHLVAVEQQRAERERLAGRPIDVGAGLDRFAAVFEEAVERAVQMEARGSVVIFSPMSLSVAISTPVLPRRGSSASPAVVKPAQRPSSQSALLAR